MTYSDLIEKHQSTQIPYAELLTAREWKIRRGQILKRDNFYCRKCNYSDSTWVKETNIYFYKASLLNNGLLHKSTPLQEFKERRGIHGITIYSTKGKNKRHFAICDAGEIFAVAIPIDFHDFDISNFLHSLVFAKARGRTEIIHTKEMKRLDRLFGVPEKSDKSVHLQVHHKLYIKENLPWEYDDDSLITLCNWCHAEVHANETIPVYTNQSGNLVEIKCYPCPRCNGQGYLPEFMHVENGVCFQCAGERFLNHLWSS